MPNENAFFIVERADGAHALKEVERVLNSLPGVSSANINLQNHLVSIGYNSSGTSYDQLENCLNKLGYQISADASEIHSR